MSSITVRLVLVSLVIFLTGVFSSTYLLVEHFGSNDSIPDLLAIDNNIIMFTNSTTSECFPYTLEDGNAYYCNLDDTIYIGSWVSTLPEPVQIFVYAHEDGHSEDPNYGYRTLFETEQYADTYGGMRMRNLYDAGKIDQQDVDVLRSWISALLPSPDHGTAQQRLAAFDEGFYGQ